MPRRSGGVKFSRAATRHGPSEQSAMIAHPTRRFTLVSVHACIVIAAMLNAILLCSAAAASLRVRLDPAASSGPVSGRLVVFLIDKNDIAESNERAGQGGKLRPNVTPLDGPLWESEQPIFSRDVRALTPGSVIEIDDSWDWLKHAPSALPAGTYRAQAVLITNRQNSRWRRDAGNLFTQTPVTVHVTAASETGTKTLNAELPLDAATKAQERPPTPGVTWFQTRSALLSTFHGREIILRAGVVKPTGFDPASDRRYAAIYSIPGFGGDDTSAADDARRRARLADAPPGPERDAALALARETFLIVPSPESPNGHTLFADSANNGPWARALIEELIPALEAAFPLVAAPEARLLRGHSSGGWSTLWLALMHPETFGACWSTAPDPVDFRRFQLIDVTQDENFFTGPASRALTSSLTGSAPGTGSDDPRVEHPSFRRASGEEERVLMTVRRETRQEDMLGTDNTSGQQWDSWFAVFGPRTPAGNPAALFDPMTGVIDRAVARAFGAYDIGARLRAEPARFLPIFRDRIRLVCGDIDNFYLEQAVRLLRYDVATADAREIPTANAIPGPDAPAPLEWRGTTGPGYIRIVPGYDHGTIFNAREVRDFPAQMLTHLTTHGLASDVNPSDARPSERPPQGPSDGAAR